MGENLNAEGYGTGHHPFSTNIGFWLYAYLAGIHPYVGEAGWDQLTLKPGVEAPLDYVAATHESPRGTVRSAWRKTADGRVAYEVTLPAGVEGLLVLPKGAKDVRLGGQPIDGVASAKPTTGEGQRWLLASGEYEIAFTLRPGRHSEAP